MVSLILRQQKDTTLAPNFYNITNASHATFTNVYRLPCRIRTEHSPDGAYLRLQDAILRSARRSYSQPLICRQLFRFSLVFDRILIKKAFREVLHEEQVARQAEAQPV